MATIGEQLKAAREAKGISQTDAGTATKILTKIIAAMEADDFSAMAAPTYAKGFIKLYAEYLGLDPAPLVEEYSKTHSTAPRRLIDSSRQLNRNTNIVTQSAADMPKIKLPTWLAKLDFIKKIPLGPLKDIRIVAGGIAALMVLAVLIGSLSTCVRKKAAEKPEEPLPEIAPARMLLEEQLPDLYLTGPDKIETN